MPDVVSPSRHKGSSFQCDDMMGTVCSDVEEALLGDEFIIEDEEPAGAFSVAKELAGVTAADVGGGLTLTSGTGGRKRSILDALISPPKPGWLVELGGILKRGTKR